jgi:pyruvate/2-oxoglutarate dehydrogenase complex dihydrolipoamide acyltransferase (E2) component
VIPDRVLKVVWGVATLGVVGVALTVSLDKPWVSPLPPKDASADAPAASAIAEAGSPPEPVIDVDASLPSTPSLTLDLIGASDASTRHVKVGVVLVQFAGAQGALPTARPKANALELARKLADEAKVDFHQAVTHGDSGSADDIGRIGRGILEPQVEGVVFGMTPGQTSEPIETPRGYWVVKRLE